MDVATPTRWGFTQASRSWYGSTSLELLARGEFEEFMIGDYPDEGGTTGEFKVVFGRFKADGDPYVRAMVFDDGMAVFDAMSGLKELIKSGRCKSPEALRTFLVGSGYVDLTQEECSSEMMVLRRSGLSKLSPEEADALNLDRGNLLPFDRD